MNGAVIGARPITSIRNEYIRAELCASKQSRTTERAITMPAQPPSAWAKRNTIRLSIEGASAQAPEAIV